MLGMLYNFDSISPILLIYLILHYDISAITDFDIINQWSMLIPVSYALLVTFFFIGWFEL